MIILEEFQVHETLNDKIWDFNTRKLQPDVKEKIIEIVSYFESQLQVPIEIVDIQVCGSNASFNYTDKSDLDVHIIANFEAVSTETELLHTVYDVSKSQFNKKYDISIHGINIELYVQDVKSICVSNGIYSVCDDEWIKEPKPLKSATKHNTEKEVLKWSECISKAIKDGEYDTLIHLLDNLYLMRHNSIAVDGEYGKGNQIFKDLRSNGVLQKLKDAIVEAVNKKLTLENISEGYTRGLVVSILNNYDE